MSDVNTIIRTRFAPSPSGHLHVGGARTALFCWAYAKARGGKFILRIEDTDQKRSSDAASMAFLEDLKWLGIDWDEGPEFDGCGGGDSGPYFQSKRLDIYNKYIEQLVSEGKAYRAFETPEELAAAREKARQEKKNYKYDRAALNLDEETIQKYLDEGRPNVVRVLVPDGPLSVDDKVRGKVEIEDGELEDFVIRKADGYPTYHFAVVVDDELMGVTNVIRGEEHLKNTLKHIVLQDALGFTRPKYGHLSLIFNPDNSKMSKRDKDKTLRKYVKEKNISSSSVIDDAKWKWWQEKKDHQLNLNEAEAFATELGVELPEINVDDFKRSGYLPEVLVNYLALLGWNPGGNIEKFDSDFLIEKFDFDRVIKSPAKFDRGKLLAFNLDAIQEMSEADFVSRLRKHAEEYQPQFIEKLSKEQFNLLAVANKERSKTLDDQFESSLFFITEDNDVEYQGTKAIRKALVNGEPNGFAHLEALIPILENIQQWDVEEVEKAVKQYAEKYAEGILGKVAQPIRIAVSGGTISPAIFDTLVILGKDSTISRMKNCLAKRIAVTSSQ